MDRKILFRGKRVDNGEWVYGYYCPKPYGCFPCEDSIFPIEKINKCWESVRIIPSTLGQFTGMTDKNGTKIFEGDIIRINSSEETFYIAFLDFSWQALSKKHETYRHRLENKSDKYKVIGNIHDGGAEI